MKKIFQSLLLAVSLFTITNPTLAQWVQANGPYGGMIGALVSSPNGIGGSDLFAGTDGSGIYYSSNNGTSWSAVNAGLTNLDVTSLAIIPDTGRTGGINLYAGTWGGGVFYSTNNGTSWITVSSGLSIKCLATCPNGVGGTSLFAGTFGGDHIAYRSTDFGKTWVGADSGMRSWQVNGFAVIQDSTGLPEIFAASSDSGIYRSTNNGSSWEPVNSGVTGRYIESISTIPNDSGGLNLLAASFDAGLFRSTNNGTSWTLVNSAMQGNSCFRAFALSPDSSGKLFAGTGGAGVYSSTDQGTSWSSLNSGLTNFTVYALCFSSDGMGGTDLFAGTSGGGVFLSTNDGTTWTGVSTGIIGQVGRMVGVPTVNGTNLFAGTYWGGGIFFSSNRGMSWTPVDSGLICNGVLPFVMCFAVDGTNVFVGTDFGVFLSTNNGTSWTAKNSGLSGAVGSLVVAPDGYGGTNIYAGVNAVGVFRSTDYGTTWSAVNSGLTDLFVKSLSATPNGTGGSFIFVGTGSGGVFRSTDNGLSWSSASSGLASLQINCLLACPTGSGGANLFAGTWAMHNGLNSVYLSTDNGLNWTPAGLTFNDISSLAASRNGDGGNILFAAGVEAPVAVSTNNGTSWNLAWPGLPPSTVISVAVSGTDLWATTYDGAWRRPLMDFMTFVITATAGDHGTISPQDTVSVAGGANKQFIMTPVAGYHVDSVIVDGIKVDSLISYTFSNVAANHTIRVTFR